MEKPKLTQRITTRIDPDQSEAISAFMAAEGMHKEGEVVRMALTQFLRSKGYLKQVAPNAAGTADKLTETKNNVESLSEKLKHRGAAKIKKAREEK